MKSNFNACLNKLLKDEGGYTNDPSDSGGATNFGITIADYRKYIDPKGSSNDVRDMSVSDAKTIYRSKYWDALDCDSLPSGIDYTAFDYGVNSGLGRPRKALQRFKSLAGTSLIDAVNNERTAFLEALASNRSKDQKFLKGWLSRVERVRSYSKKLATKDNSTGPAIGAGTLGIGASLYHFWHGHETLIIASTIALAFVIGIAVHLYRNKGKSNG